jgi:hypothetical protein
MLTTVLLVLTLSSLFMATLGTWLLNRVLQPKSDGGPANFIKLPLLMLVKVMLPWSAWLATLVFGALLLLSYAR